jgi:hypothetical protein
VTGREQVAFPSHAALLAKLHPLRPRVFPLAHGTREAAAAGRWFHAAGPGSPHAENVRRVREAWRAADAAYDEGGGGGGVGGGERAAEASRGSVEAAAQLVKFGVAPPRFAGLYAPREGSYPPTPSLKDLEPREGEGGGGEGGDEGGRGEMEVLMLGTAASVPGKYRNVSGALVQVLRGARGSLLLDAGEGTAGQLFNRFGAAGARAAIAELRCVWVSHMHADHHIGLLRILSQRARVAPGAAPLTVVGPNPLRKWLNAYGTIEPIAFDFVSNAKLAASAQWTGGDPLSGTVAPPRAPKP